MSANLLIQNGKASMFYIDEVPWHGLGQKLDKPATAQEAIRAEVDHPMAIDQHLTTWSELVHHEVFHVAIGIQLRKVVEEPDDAAAPQRLREPPHRVAHELVHP